MKTTRQRVFIDSSVWIALSSKKDSLHENAVELMNRIKKEQYSLVTSVLVLNETLTKLRLKYGQDNVNVFFRALNRQKDGKEIKIISSHWQDIEHSVQLMNDYPTPNTFSHTDANCIALMKKHHIDTIATFDKDFKKLGVRVLP